MKIGDDEYNAKLKQWLKEEYDRIENKPQGFYGNWAFSAQKTKEFIQLMRMEGKLEE